jgi:hypothetical protein
MSVSGNKLFNVFAGLNTARPNIDKLISDQLINIGPTTHWSTGSLIAIASAMVSNDRIREMLLGENQEEWLNMLTDAQGVFQSLSVPSGDQNALFESLQKL